MKKRGMNKKGISPTVATILLVGFVVLIILIILFWSRDVYQERAEKAGAVAQTLTDCEFVNIEVSATPSNIEVRNTGSVDLDGLSVKEDFGANIRLSDIIINIPSGESVPLVRSDVICGEGTEPTSPLSLCGNSESARIWPGKTPEGNYRNAPLVKCTNKFVDIKL